VSYEGGILEDPWKSPPDEIFQMTVSPEQAPNKPQEVEIEYERGNPGRRRRQEDEPGRSCWHISISWAGRMASAGSIWLKTATSE
jgi:argininosuccinate synthase